MTLEEFNKVPFSLVSHLNMEHEHCSTYTNRDKRGYADLSGYKLDRSKPISQKNKEKTKRRKKNKNKKTHRK